MVVRKPTAVMGAWGRGKGNAYAAMLLAKNLILIDRAQRQTIPMDQFRYGGYVLMLLFFGGGAGERESGELRIDPFFNIGFYSYVTRSIEVCMYVGNTKCVQPP